MIVELVLRAFGVNSTNGSIEKMNLNFICNCKYIVEGHVLNPILIPIAL